MRRMEIVDRTSKVVGAAAQRVEDLWWAHPHCDMVCAIIVALVVVGLDASMPSGIVASIVVNWLCLAAAGVAIVNLKAVERMAAFCDSQTTIDARKRHGNPWMTMSRELATGNAIVMVMTVLLATNTVSPRVGLGAGVGLVVLTMLVMDRASRLYALTAREWTSGHGSSHALDEEQEPVSSRDKARGDRKN